MGIHPEKKVLKQLAGGPQKERNISRRYETILWS
jgi:hypothetical protein